MTTNTKRLTRSEVSREQTWYLTDCIAGHEEWEEELSAIQANVSDVTQYKGRLTSSAENLLNGLKAKENFEQRLIRVVTYANLKSSADGSDPQNQADSAKVSSVLAAIGAELSFVDNELLQLSDDVIEHCISSEPESTTYRKMLEDILKKKPFTMAPEIEETLAALDEVHSAPFMIYERSKSSDMQFEPIGDSTGNKLPMSAALYED